MPLHPEYQAMLAQFAEVDGPALTDLPVEQGREMYRQMQPVVDIPVGNIEARSIDGPSGSIDLRIYHPAGDGPFPIVMMFHGGGWVIGDLDTADSQSRELCNGAGAIVVSVDYRLAPEHHFPAAAEDCYAATEWAHRNAADLGGDAGRFAVAGDSAGGNLSAVVAQMARDRGGPAIGLQVLVYPVIDGTSFDTTSYRDNAEGYLLTTESMRWFWDHYAPEPADRASPYASPIHAETLTNLPKALVITAEFDPLRDEGEAYGARLADAGVAVETVRFDGMIHGFFSHGQTIPASRPGMEKVCAVIKSTFEG